MRRVYQLLAKLMAIAAVLLLGFGPGGPAGAKPVTQQYQDLKIVYTASVANTMAKSIHLVLQDASGKALNKFKVSVTAKGFTVTGDSDSFTLTGDVNDGATVTLRIKSVAAYKGTISLQSASFMNGGNTVGHRGGDRRGAGGRSDLHHHQHGRDVARSDGDEPVVL